MNNVIVREGLSVTNKASYVGSILSIMSSTSSPIHMEASCVQPRLWKYQTSIFHDDVAYCCLVRRSKVLL